MDKNTGSQGSRAHIDTLTVQGGYAFAVTPLQTIKLGERTSPSADESFSWLYLPAGRGE